MAGAEGSLPYSGSQMYETIFPDKPLGETLHPGGLALTGEALGFCSLPAGIRILDVGCGTGQTVRYLEEQGYAAIGLDVSCLLIHSNHKPGGAERLIQADAEYLPMKPGSVNAILAECVLSGFVCVELVLKEFHRILPPGGTLIVTDLYARNPAGLSAVRKFFPASCFSRAFNQTVFCEHLASTGFSVKVWHDRSDVMRALSTGGTLETFSGESTSGLDPMEILLTLAPARIGYFICVAEKLP